MDWIGMFGWEGADHSQASVGALILLQEAERRPELWFVTPSERTRHPGSCENAQTEARLPVCFLCIFAVPVQHLSLINHSGGPV